MRAYRVNFTNSASMHLASLSERTGLDQAEVVRQALTLYRWLVEQREMGNRIVVERDAIVAKLPLIGEVRDRRMFEVQFAAGTFGDLDGEAQS